MRPVDLRGPTGSASAPWIVARETPRGRRRPARAGRHVLVFALEPDGREPLDNLGQVRRRGDRPSHRPASATPSARRTSRFAAADGRRRDRSRRGPSTARRSSSSTAWGPSSRPGVEFRPAGDLWGLSAAEAERRIRAEHGPAWQVAAIGPAGERLIPFATISHDGRHAGRGGLGAVMGSKKIKATRRPGATAGLLWPTLGRTVEPPRQGLPRLLARPGDREIPRAGHSRQPARFQSVRRSANEEFPKRPLRGGRAAGRARPRPLAGHRQEVVRLLHDRLRAHLPGRARRAGRGWSTNPSSPSVQVSRGVDDPDFVLRAATPRRDDAGLDTISTGGTIAFFMECVERGWIDGRLTPSGRWLRFGDGEAVLDAVASLVDREGIGETGSRLPGAGPRPGGSAGVERPRPARQGTGASRLRPEGLAHDGARPGCRHARGRPQPIEEPTRPTSPRCKVDRRRGESTPPWRRSRPRTARP